MAKRSCCVRISCSKSAALGSVPQQPQFHRLLAARARLAGRRGDMRVVIMVYLDYCVSRSDLRGCIMDLDGTIISNTTEVLHPLTNHHRILTLRLAPDHPFRNWNVQKSELRDCPY